MSAGRLTLLSALTIVALGPAAAGDFGRPDPSLLDGLIPRQFWTGPVTGYSNYPLTDAEEELRDRAYVLIRPEAPRGTWNVWVAEFYFTQLLPPSATHFDHTAYGRMLLWTPGRSEASQYNRLLDDMAGDGALIGPFVAVACQVGDLDTKRTRSLDYVGELTPAEAKNALGRVKENRMVTAWVQRALHHRVGSYRYALERLVIAVPSPLAIEAERVLTRLDNAVLAADAPLAQCGGEAIAVAAPIERPLVTK